MNEKLELQCFGLISQAGDARSSFIEAIQYAAEGDYEAAESSMKSGHKAFAEGHCKHAEMLAEEVNETTKYEGLLTMHAEDQLMSAEIFEILAEQFISLYKKLDEKEGK